MSGAALLTLNAGSSSLKFSIYEQADEPVELGRGQVEKLGPNAVLKIGATGQKSVTEEIGQADHATALVEILDHIAPLLAGREVVAVGHRIVHGGPDLGAPVELDRTLFQTLRGYERLAPLHQPFNLAGVRAATAAFPKAVQVACFDTAFHRGHPWEHDAYALPREMYDRGIRRYGFHGLSYDYIRSELRRSHPDLSEGKVIVAHLGNGASMCAMTGGQSLTCTMGFSPLDGLPMGTRCGELDPGVLLYLMEQENMGLRELNKLLYRDSGLLGLSGLTHDMRNLLASGDQAAQDAVSYYVARVRHEIGALAADLGGLETLVFTGGVGENSDVIRARVLDGMGWLGLSLDGQANAKGDRKISTGSINVLVIPTDEERVIARATCGFVAARAGA